MGAYLSKPNKETVCESGGNKSVTYGGASMQGWRVKQEDSHNAIADFTDDWALFAVYDGHGGPDVSAYTADKLPSLLRQRLADLKVSSDELAHVLPTTSSAIVNELPARLTDGEVDDNHSNGHSNADKECKSVEAAPVDEEEKVLPNGAVDKDEEPPAASAIKELFCGAFLEFDAQLCEEESMAALRQLAGKEEEDEDDDETVDGLDDPSELYSEAHMPLQDVLRQYGVMLVKNKEGKKFLTKETDKPAAKRRARVEENDVKRVKVDEPRRCFSVGPVGAAVLPSPRQRVSKSEQCDTHDKQAYNRALANEGKIMKIYEETSRLADCKEGGESPETVTAPPDEEEPGKTDSESDDVDYVENDCSSDEEVVNSADMMSMLSSRLSGEGEESESSSDDDTPVMPTGDTPGEDSGTTACVALVSSNVVCVANAGDSRAVMCRKGECVELSFDHKPDDQIESKRIALAGGRVTPDGRVNGGLNLSRAFGDHYYKKNGALPLGEQMITAKPDVVLQRITEEDEFIVIACDGIWNTLSSGQVVDYVKTRLDSGMTPVAVAEELCFECLADNTDGDGTGCDNMTVLVIRFAPPS